MLVIAAYWNDAVENDKIMGFKVFFLVTANSFGTKSFVTEE